MRDFGIPEVVGDPAGMRALAARLRADAERTHTLAAGAEGQVLGARMQGPGPKTLFKQIRSWRTGADKVSRRLVDLAAYLDHEAADVQRRQDERRRTIARLTQEAQARGKRP